MEFYMLVLALDTTTRKGSVALLRDGVVLDCDSGNPAVTHGQRLPGDVIQLLERQNLSVRDVELFAVAAGPGSFTGLRIGIATMQGLALATGRSLIGVSALDALNASVQSALSSTAGLKASTTATVVPTFRSAGLKASTAATVVPTFRSAVGVWMDAQREEVFSALYDGSTVLDGPSVEKPEAVLARWRSALDLSAAVREGRRVTFVGEGACLYAELIRREMTNAQILATVPPLAPSIARLAEEQARLHGPSAPDAIRPMYIRRPDAELARDKEPRAARGEDSSIVDRRSKPPRLNT
jgi:tRNA threonylcarbamoyladenosine biosynthesis protein TsaB